MKYQRKASLYSPREEDMFKKTATHPRRLIFYQVQYFDYEKKAIREFKAYCEEQKVPHQHWDDVFILRYLQSTDYDHQTTVEAMRYCRWWELENLERIRKSSAVQKLLNSGTLYWHGRDVGQRPILIVDIPRIIDLGLDGEALTDLAVYLLSWGIDNLMVPGRVQNWVIIVDMGNISTTSIPHQQLKSIVQAMQALYRARLFRLFIINMPFLAYALWKVVSNFISQFTIQNVDVQRTSLEPLHNLVPLTELQQKFEGLAPNVKGEYFPPEQLKESILSINTL